MKVTPWYGLKISEPGIYSGVPMDAYHGDLCTGPSVSSSVLRTIELKTPLHAYATSYLNPDREPDEQKDYFNFGRAVHTLLLGEKGFRDQYAVRPETWKDWRTKAAQQWRDEQVEAGRTVLTLDQIAAIRGIAGSLGKHSLVDQGILQGLVEHTIISRDDPTGIFLKARPDVLPTADGIVVDIKTTTDASPEAVRRTILKFGYAMQGALVGQVMKAALKIEMTGFALVFVEKTAPYAVNIVEIDMEWIWYAHRQLRRAIDTFAQCVKANEFPGYEGERVVHIPDWLRKKLDDEMDVGLLPREENAA